MDNSRFHAFVEWLLDNIFDVVTVSVACYLVIRNQIEPFSSGDTVKLSNWILAVLGLIAISGLWERNRLLRRIENFSEENNNLISRHLNRSVRASDFFLSERKLSDEVFSSANTIFLLGYSLSRTIRDFTHILNQRLAAGATIHVIIIDPEIETLLQSVALQSITSNVENWKRTLQTTEAFVNALGQVPEVKGKIEIGYLPYTPSFGLVMIDPYESHGFCFTDIYHHKTTAPNAKFRLSASDDPFWFEFYRKQYEYLWESCRIRRLPD